MSERSVKCWGEMSVLKCCDAWPGLELVESVESVEG